VPLRSRRRRAFEIRSDFIKLSARNLKRCRSVQSVESGFEPLAGVLGHGEMVTAYGFRSGGESVTLRDLTLI
jgi:hypothetical protein